MITVDFETRSRLDITKVGSWLYAKHPSTEPLCLCYDMGDGEVKTWHPAFPGMGVTGTDHPWDLFDAVERGELLEAHNSFFERCVWHHVMVERYGWPEVPEDQWRCSASKASASSLPRALEKACEAMKTTEQKDMEGSKVMKKMAKPKKDGGWHEDLKDFLVLLRYCRQDVRAERALSESIADLTPRELEVWRMDQRMNWRGVKVDVELCRAALNLAEELRARNGVRFHELTGLRTGQRAAFLAFLRTWGAPGVENTKAETLEPLLSDEALDADVREAVSLFVQNNRTSVRKYDAMIRLADPDDGRIRGAVVYCGAERTGRWAGKGMQPHNYPKGHIADMVAACELILARDLDRLLAEMESHSRKHPDGRHIGFRDAMEFLSHALRGALVPEDGRDFLVADFAAIEARVIMWLAGELEALGILAGGQCIYCDMATDIFKFEVNKKEHPDERAIGKQAILGLGFGMGAAKFLETCAKYGIVVDDEFADHVVKTYRKKYPNITDFWVRQEDGAIKAMYYGTERANEHFLHIEKVRADEGGLPVDEDGWVWSADNISWKYEAPFLRCCLPSGRCIVYPQAKLVDGSVYYFKSKNAAGTERWLTVNRLDGKQLTDAQIVRMAQTKARKKGLKLDLTSSKEGRPFFERRKPTLKYWGVNPETKQAGWEHTYSGKLTENIVQATARDLMAEAMMRADAHPDYDLTLSVHDESIVEVDAWVGSLHEFEALTAVRPAWAEGCPVAAEGFRSTRYRK